MFETKNEEAVSSLFCPDFKKSSFLWKMEKIEVKTEKLESNEDHGGSKGLFESGCHELHRRWSNQHF